MILDKRSKNSEGLLDSDLLRETLMGACEALMSDDDGRNRVPEAPLTIFHVLADPDLEFTLHAAERNLRVSFERPVDPDVILSMTAHVFHEIQMGRLNPVEAGVRGKMEVIEGDAMRLLALQNIPISAFYARTARTVGLEPATTVESEKR